MQASASYYAAFENDEVLAAEGLPEQAELYAARAEAEQAYWSDDAWDGGLDQLADDPAYVAWCEEQDARGDLAGSPETIGCYECGGFDGVTAPEKKVVKLGPIAEAHRDPTQTYVLECGHTTI